MMMVGMLWFDGDKNANLVKKIEQALVYYRKKYLAKAELCLINEKDAQGTDLSEASKACGLVVKTAKSVQPGHLWIGVEESPVAGVK